MDGFRFHLYCLFVPNTLDAPTLARLLAKLLNTATVYFILIQSIHNYHQLCSLYLLCVLMVSVLLRRHFYTQRYA